MVLFESAVKGSLEGRFYEASISRQPLFAAAALR
jgi:hypothetical protein